MSKLALYGGTPVRTAPFAAWPQWGQREEERLVEVLKAGQWGTLGDQAMAFAKRFAAFQDCEYGLAVNNGTQALEIALRALGLGYGDEVIVPAYTFIATASAVAACGITPVFADVDPITFCLNAEDARRRITPRTRAIIAVHYAGRPADMEAIMTLAREYGLKVVEDCAQAHGAAFQGRKVGSIGDVGAFSFQGTKNLACGEGGMIVTNSRDIYSECWHYHTSGRALEGASELGGVVLMGTNGRMAEWEAGILDVQMDALPAQMALREENARRLREMLQGREWLSLPPEDARITAHAYHLFTFVLKGEVLNLDRAAWLERVRAEGIPAEGGYEPLYRDPMFASQSFKRMTMPPEAPYGPLTAVEAAAPWNVLLTQNMLLGTQRDLQDIVDAFDKVAEEKA